MIGRYRICLLTLTAALVLLGCGGSSGPLAGLTGAVTDVKGWPVAGALVTVGNDSTTSLSNGTFAFPNVQSGQRLVRAVVTIQGRRWSGETIADIAINEQNRSISV